jgi:hypothetical protein
VHGPTERDPRRADGWFAGGSAFSDAPLVGQLCLTQLEGFAGRSVLRAWCPRSPRRG